MSIPVHSAVTLALVAAAAACSEPAPVVHERVRMAFAHDDAVDVIVGFADPGRPRGDLVAHRTAIRAVAQRLGVTPGFVPKRHFDHVPAVAGRLTRDGLAALAADPDVSFIQLDSPGHGDLAVSVPALGADVARNQFHVTGKGVRVAVLDTGVNGGHPDLASSIVPTQHCFTQGDCPPDHAAEGDSAEDDHGHGSHVTGIITSDGTVAGMGFAPDAEIVAVKVNDGNDAGYASDWAAGFDWIFANLATLDVKVVNASFGTSPTYASTEECERGEPALARAVKNLIDAGVTVFASAGNRGSITEMSAPACLPGVITVGATYKSNQGRQPSNGTYASLWGTGFADCADETTAFDKVACFTTSGPRLDVVAPGAIIVSDALGTRTESYWGTSQASPTAAGIAALVLECAPDLGPNALKDLLVRTAVPVPDPKANASYPSLRADRAVAAACARSVDADAGHGVVDGAAALDAEPRVPGGGTGGADGGPGRVDSGSGRPRHRGVTGGGPPGRGVSATVTGPGQGSGTAGDGGAGVDASSASAESVHASSDAGCACRIPEAGSAEPPLLALATLGLLATVRDRRRRS